MRLILSFALLVILATSCKKEIDCCAGPKDLPQCIQEMIADTSISNKLITIQRTQVGNEQHFWLNSGASAWDGPEYIVNEQCDTVCLWLCFCLPAACADVYDINEFEIVWQK